MNNYKLTLNLPKTDFPMRANLAKREPEILTHWINDDLYKLVRDSKKGKKIFLLHDGPPYANGDIHIGHSVNKILKDIIIKSKILSDFDTPYIPGWDCHGLPIELKVEQKYGKPGERFTASEFRMKCREYATKQINNQRKDFIRLGILGDWLNPYLTMNFKTEANTIRVLSKIIKNGFLHKGTKPIYWCINCRSALSEAEVQYYEINSPSIYVMFKAVNQNIVRKQFNLSNSTKPVFLVIWTTTPWTLPANRAITLSPEFEYALVDTEERNLILAKDLVSNVMEHIHIYDYTVLSTINAMKLELLSFHHPFLQLTVPVILGNYITLKEGTGAVHTAGGHGLEDYHISKKYNLEIANLVKIDGTYFSGIHPSLDGLNVFQANDLIVNILCDKKALLYSDTLQHNYPHCWRHKTPVIFRTTPQWFINIHETGLREQLLKVVKNVVWIPEWGKSSITSMLLNRPDWCISRQRTWGVPMSLLIHKQTKELHPCMPKLMEKIAQHVEINGIQAWWDLDLNDLLHENSNLYEKVTDTLDVWFDSGSTHTSVINTYLACSNHYVSDMYLEGSDQYRGWFMASLIISTLITGKAPYRQVLTHGFAVDKHGRKMSKSIGNIISPKEIVNTFGADILRLWVASTDYTSDMAISQEILNHVASHYRRIRNTMRFLLANLYDFNPINDMVKPNQMIVLDRWAVNCAKLVQQRIINAYTCYNFHEVVKLLINFCSIEMSSFYLDIIKDRLYTTKKNSIARRSGQTAMYHIAESLLRWIAPIISFTADEIWNYLPGKRSKYVFTDVWYKQLFSLDDTDLMNNDFWNEILKIRSEINKIIEQWRFEKKIKSSLEIEVTIYAKQQLAEKLTLLGEELKFVFLISNIKIFDYSNATDDSLQSELFYGVKISLTKISGKKCSRCWHYSESIGRLEQYIDICQRCVDNVIGNGEKRRFV